MKMSWEMAAVIFSKTPTNPLSHVCVIISGRDEKIKISMKHFGVVYENGNMCRTHQ